MKITILCVGKIKEDFYKKAVCEYVKRLGRYCKLEIIEVSDEKTPDSASLALEKQIKEKENHVQAFVTTLVEEAKKRFNEKYGHEPQVYPVVISDGAHKVCEACH